MLPNFQRLGLHHVTVPTAAADKGKLTLAMTELLDNLRKDETLRLTGADALLAKLDTWMAGTKNTDALLKTS